jgi:hypothetical protein
MCWAVMGAVFLLSNPYAALKPERYLLDFAGIGFFSSYNFLVASAGKMGSYFQEIFMKSYLVPISLLAVPGMIHAVVRESGFIARLAAGTLFIFLLMSVTVNNARITLFIGPPLCLFSGYALHISAHYLRNAAIHWKAIPLVALFIPGVFFAGLSIRDLASHDHWFAPTMAWIRSERISEGASIGVFERPAPTGTPPYPFVNAKLVNLNEKVAAYTPDYVILGFYENARRWETHPLRPKYEPTFDLGLRSSYTWFGNLRTRPPVTAAMVYKLRVNQSRRP